MRGTGDLPKFFNPHLYAAVYSVEEFSGVRIIRRQHVEPPVDSGGPSDAGDHGVARCAIPRRVLPADCRQERGHVGVDAAVNGVRPLFAVEPGAVAAGMDPGKDGIGIVVLPVRLECCVHQAGHFAQGQTAGLKEDAGHECRIVGVAWKMHTHPLGLFARRVEVEAHRSAAALQKIKRPFTRQVLGSRLRQVCLPARMEQLAQHERRDKAVFIGQCLTEMRHCRTECSAR